MKQKFQDLIVLLKGSRAAQVTLGLIVVAIIYALVQPEGRKPMRRVTPQKAPSLSSRNDKESAEDLMTRFNADLIKMRELQERNAEDLTEQRKQLQDYEQRTAEILKKMLERIQQTQEPGGATAGQNMPTPLSVDEPAALGDQPADAPEEMETFGTTEAAVAPPPPPPAQKVAYVGAGDSVRIKLLAGVNAPTDGTPYPVVFKLVGDVAGPDGSKLPLGEARLIAAAQGSLPDSRALFRLTSLNLQLPTGERKVIDVDGWVVGEDGIRGMAGYLIDPIGKAIGGAAIAGGVAGMGQGLAAANTRVRQDANGGISTQVTGNVAEFAAGNALSGAARQWSTIIRQRLRELTPVVQVLSGREGTAVFAKSVSVEGLYEALADDDAGGMSSLD